MKSKFDKLGLIAAIFISSLCALTGCAVRMTPKVAANRTALAVYVAGRSNPEIVKEMRTAQPPACAVIQDGATVEDVIGEIQNSTNLSPKTKDALNIFLAIFQTATAPSGTNVAKANPYLKAVFCDGWYRGLRLLPDPESRGIIPPPENQTPSNLPQGNWILLR